MDMFNDEDTTAIELHASKREAFEKFVGTLPSIRPPEHGSTGRIAQAVDMGEVDDVVVRYNQMVEKMSSHREEAMLDGRACRGSARILRNLGHVHQLAAVVLTYPTTNEVKLGAEVEVSDGAGFGSNARMVPCLSYSPCATAQSIMPILLRLLQLYPHLAFVICDACPTSTNVGSQQQVPCKAILGKFTAPSKLLLAELSKVVNGIFFASTMAFDLCGRPSTGGVPTIVNKIHPGQCMFACASLNLKYAYMTEQILNFFKLLVLAGVHATSDMARVIIMGQLELVLAKNTQGKFFNVASWVSAMHSCAKMLLLRSPGGDPGGKKYETWKHGFHSGLGTLGGRLQYCGSSSNSPL